MQPSYRNLRGLYSSGYAYGYFSTTVGEGRLEEVLLEQILKTFSFAIFVHSVPPLFRGTSKASHLIRALKLILFLMNYTLSLIPRSSGSYPPPFTTVLSNN